MKWFKKKEVEEFKEDKSLSEEENNERFKKYFKRSKDKSSRLTKIAMKQMLKISDQFLKQIKEAKEKRLTEENTELDKKIEKGRLAIVEKIIEMKEDDLNGLNFDLMIDVETKDDKGNIVKSEREMTIDEIRNMPTDEAIETFESILNTLRV